MLANMCLPTVLANKCLSCVQKVGQHSMLANNVGRLQTCWFFVGQQTANRALWLVGCSKQAWRQNGRMHLALTTLIILLHFTSTLSKQISGAYVFAYEQLNKSLLQQCRRCLLSPAISATLLSNKMLSCVTRMLANNCLPTNVVQQLLANICLSCVRGFSSSTSW